MKTFKELLNDKKTWPDSYQGEIMAKALVYWALHTKADLTRDDTLEALVGLAAISYYGHKKKRETLFGEMPTEYYNLDPKRFIFPLPRHAITSDLLQKAKRMRAALDNNNAPRFSGSEPLKPEIMACLVGAGMTFSALKPCRLGPIVDGIKFGVVVQQRKEAKKNGSLKTNKNLFEGDVDEEFVSSILDSSPDLNDLNKELDSYFMER